MTVTHPHTQLCGWDPRVHSQTGFWATSGYFGPLWGILGHFGVFWATLGYFGPLWGILGHFGVFWATLGYFGPPGGVFWAITQKTMITLFILFFFVFFLFFFNNFEKKQSV